MVYVIICGHFVSSSYINLLIFYPYREHFLVSNVSVDIELEKLDSNVDTKPDTNSRHRLFQLVSDHRQFSLLVGYYLQFIG